MPWILWNSPVKVRPRERAARPGSVRKVPRVTGSTEFPDERAGPDARKLARYLVACRGYSRTRRCRSGREKRQRRRGAGGLGGNALPSTAICVGLDSTMPRRPRLAWQRPLSGSPVSRGRVPHQYTCHTGRCYFISVVTRAPLAGSPCWRRLHPWLPPVVRSCDLLSPALDETQSRRRGTCPGGWR